MTDTPLPNGSAEAPIELSLPSVVGINFGNSYASIAVLSKVSGRYGSTGRGILPGMLDIHQETVLAVKHVVDLFY